MPHTFTATTGCVAKEWEQSHGRLQKAKYKQEIKGNMPATLLSLAQKEFLGNNSMNSPTAVSFVVHNKLSQLRTRGEIWFILFVTWHSHREAIVVESDILPLLQKSW